MEDNEENRVFLNLQLVNYTPEDNIIETETTESQETEYNECK